MTTTTHITVKQALAERYSRVRGLHYQGCPVVFIDWHPSKEGTHHAEIRRDGKRVEVWLTPETPLEERHAAAAR